MKNEKDILKSFIEDKKDAFDQLTPPSMDFSMLGKTKKKTPKGKMIPISWLYRAVAIFVILIAAMGVTYLMVSKKTEDTSVSQKQNLEAPTQNDFQLGEISQEMAELEYFYKQEVSQKLSELKSLGVADEVATEIAALDTEFDELKSELGASVDNHLIVNEMIKTYKLKLDLLEDVLLDMQDNYEDTHLTQNNTDETYTTYH